MTDEELQRRLEFACAPQPEPGGASEAERECAKRRTLDVYRQMPTQLKMRMLSDAALADELDWHFAPGDCWHMLTGGDVDGTSVLLHVLRQQPAPYVLVATWCMGRWDVEQLSRHIDRGNIGRMDVYTGEVFKSSRHAQPSEIRALAARGGGRFVRMMNHAKVCLVYGESVDVCIESSANLNTNPRCENTVITCDTGLCDFYKAWFDSQPHERRGDWPDWSPWERG